MSKLNKFVEYIWLDGSNPQKVRSKVKITKSKNPKIWNFDGSSTNQAETKDSELLLYPVSEYKNPFNEGSLILNEVRNIDGTPHSSNTRSLLYETLSNYDIDDVMVGIEQEYFIFQNGYPIGTDRDNFKGLKQGDFYCGVGYNRVSGRDIAEEHANLCLKAGIDISGINAEVAKGQWEYQIGTVGAMDGCDQIWVSRWILERLSEKWKFNVVWHPKPIDSLDWNGSGMHVNISTKNLRENLENKKMIAISYCVKLGMNLDRHLDVYGLDNHLRLTGHNETCSISEFKWGIGDRTASIRIPSSILDDTTPGYIEDRRPGSNADPYKVINELVKTIKS